MNRYCQFVLGPAGCGKSKYCAIMRDHYEIVKRTVHVVNLDPAVEVLPYTPSIDMKDLITLDDVMEGGPRLGPNGGLLYCMDHLVQNLEWLRDALDNAGANYVIVDCPGQIELYVSSDVMQRLVQALASWGYNVCSVYVVDCTCAIDPFRFCGVIMSSQDAMVKLETPFMMVMMKVDLLKRAERKKLYRYINPDNLNDLLDEVEENPGNKGRIQLFKKWISVMENFPMSDIMPLNVRKQSTLVTLAAELDRIMQYEKEPERLVKCEIQDQELIATFRGEDSDSMGQASDATPARSAATVNLGVEDTGKEEEKEIQDQELTATFRGEDSDSMGQASNATPAQSAATGNLAVGGAGKDEEKLLKMNEAVSSALALLDQELTASFRGEDSDSMGQASDATPAQSATTDILDVVLKKETKD